MGVTIGIADIFNNLFCPGSAIDSGEQPDCNGKKLHARHRGSAQSRPSFADDTLDLGVIKGSGRDRR